MVFWEDSFSGYPLWGVCPRWGVCPLWGACPLSFRIASYAPEYFLVRKEVNIWYDIEILSLVSFESTVSPAFYCVGVPGHRREGCCYQGKRKWQQYPFLNLLKGSHNYFGVTIARPFSPCLLFSLLFLSGSC